MDESIYASIILSTLAIISNIYLYYKLKYQRVYYINPPVNPPSPNPSTSGLL
jgi:hypothetical protein